MHDFETVKIGYGLREFLCHAKTSMPIQKRLVVSGLVEHIPSLSLLSLFSLLSIATTTTTAGSIHHDKRTKPRAKDQFQQSKESYQTVRWSRFLVLELLCR